MTISYILHLFRNNDTNGNPMRAYVAYNGNGSIIEVWEEGYRGISAVPEEYLTLAEKAPSIQVTPTQYRKVLNTKKLAA